MSRDHTQENPGKATWWGAEDLEKIKIYNAPFPTKFLITVQYGETYSKTRGVGSRPDACVRLHLDHEEMLSLMYSDVFETPDPGYVVPKNKVLKIIKILCDYAIDAEDHKFKDKIKREK